MQAPTTPSGAPAQEPDERSCPNCGTANGHTAAFCWQCYQPFGTPSSPPGHAGAQGAAWVPPGSPGYAPQRAPGSVPARPQGWTPAPEPFPAPAPSRNLGSMLGVVLVTLAVIAGVYWFFNRSDAVAVPGTIGGLTVIDDAQTQLVSETFRGQVETMGIEGDMAMYGHGTPSAALIWIRDASVPTTDAAFDEFASGFDAGIGSQGSLNAAKKTRETVEGVTYVCAPVVSVAPGTICMWQDEDVFWLLFDFSGAKLTAGQDLAVVAHDAVDPA